MYVYLLQVPTKVEENWNINVPYRVDTHDIYKDENIKI